MIQNFDTNGLIHLMNYTWAKKNGCKNEATYHDAIENILDSQGFDCIPLVDRPRVRANVNNLFNRATYLEDQGNVTHIARKRHAFEEGSAIKIINIAEIPHVDETTDLFDVLKLLFSKNQNKHYHFITTVGGTSEQPNALFTFAQLQSPSVIDEIYRRISHHALVQDDEKLKELALMTSGGLFEKVCNLVDIDEVEQVLSHITDLMANVPDTKKSMSGRKTGTLLTPTFGDLNILDVMTMVSTGIQWETSRSPQEQPVNKVAKTILQKANDFTYLAVYQKGKLVPHHVISRSRDQAMSALSCSPMMNLREFLLSLKPTNDKDFVAIVPPDNSIITAEGPMIYPGILTAADLKQPLALMSFFSVCAMIEVRMREATSHIYQEKKNMTLGQTIHWLFSLKKEQINERYAVISELFNCKNARERETIEKQCWKVNTLRKALAHQAAVVAFPNQSIDVGGVTLNHIREMYDLAMQLEIFGKKP